MAYRISLHLLATIWHLLLLVVAGSLRRTHRFYSALIPVCLFSVAFTAAWACGLIFESEIAMRLTWIGALWPAAMIFFVRDLFELPTAKWMKLVIWGISTLGFLVGTSRSCLVAIVRYEPSVVAIYGWLEPYLRVLLLLQMIFLLYSIVPQFFVNRNEHVWSFRISIFGFVAYGLAALLTAALLPLFGEYRFLEASSYGSAIWTTFSVWCVFEELHRQNKCLIELDLLKKDLINHVTHEFRTPLYAIVSATELLEGSEPDRKQSSRQYLDMIASNTTRLSGFIDQLLDLAAIQQAKVQLHKTEINIKTLIEKIIHQLRPIIDAQLTTVKLNGEECVIHCDEERIQQAVANLISNALKAAPGGVIEIGLMTTEKNLEIAVSDNGVGIDPKHLSQIFSSFYRVAIKSDTKKGSGLGLAIAKGWIEAHGGKIQAWSEGIGKGSTFVMSLPRENL